MSDEELQALTDEELIKLYKREYECWQGYRHIQDGSYMMCYAYRVEPVEKECNRRGLEKEMEEARKTASIW